MNKGVRKWIILSVLGAAVLVGAFFFIIRIVDVRDAVPEESLSGAAEEAQRESMESSEYSQENITTKIISQSQSLGGGMYLFFQGEKKSKFSNPEYAAYYYTGDQSVRIIVYGEASVQTRRDAEAVFLEKLGISRTQACEMDVTIAISEEADPDRAGENLPLSFCE